MNASRTLTSAANKKAYRLLKELAPHVVEALLKMAHRGAPADADAMARVVDAADIASVMSEVHERVASEGVK